jgi:polysaccharide biosynthesis/export protein
VLLSCAGSLVGCGASLTEGNFTAVGTTDPAQEKVGLQSSSPSATADKGLSPVKAADLVTAGSVAGTPGYKIGPQDVLEVSVFKVPELSKSVQVAEAGTINLPLVGEIKAAGKMPQQVEQDLAKKLGAKYLQSPQVTVYVKEFNSQRITVDGAVRKPGVYPFRGKGTLLQYLAMAEGLDSSNSDSTVVVFRQQAGKRSAAKFDIDNIREGQAEDPIVQSGDVIVAGTSVAKETFNAVLKALPVAGVFTLL